MIKWRTAMDYNHTTYCTWSPYLVASSALLLEMLISPYPPAANGFEVWTASVKGNTSTHQKKKWLAPPHPSTDKEERKGQKKTGTTMAGRFECVCCVTKVKHEYKSRLGALVEVVGEASWGVAEVSFFIRGCRDFFFPFKHLSTPEVSVVD